VTEPELKPSHSLLRRVAYLQKTQPRPPCASHRWRQAHPGAAKRRRDAAAKVKSRLKRAAQHKERKRAAN